MVKRHPLNMTPPGWKGEDRCKHDKGITFLSESGYHCFWCGAQPIVVGQRHEVVTDADGVQYIREVK